jgi:hypothetical protein
LGDFKKHVRHRARLGDHEVVTRIDFVIAVALGLPKNTAAPRGAERLGTVDIDAPDPFCRVAVGKAKGLIESLPRMRS